MQSLLVPPGLPNALRFPSEGEIIQFLVLQGVATVDTAAGPPSPPALGRGLTPPQGRGPRLPQPGRHRPCSHHRPCRWPRPRPRSGHRDPTGHKLPRPEWFSSTSPLSWKVRGQPLVREHVDPAAQLFASARVAWHCLLESSRKLQSSQQKGAGSVWVMARADRRVPQW